MLVWQDQAWFYLDSGPVLPNNTPDKIIGKFKINNFLLQVRDIPNMSTSIFYFKSRSVERLNYNYLGNCEERTN